MTVLLKVLKALSDETRLRLVKLLLQHDYCVGALSRKLKVSEPAVSQHLKILKSAELVSAEKRGYFVHYYVHHDPLVRAAGALNELAQARLKKFNGSKGKNGH